MRQSHIDDLVKSRKTPLSVIPAKAGIQFIQVVEGSGSFSSQPMDLAEWISSSNIAHCLNALGIVKKEQPTAFVVMKMETPYAWLSSSFY